MNQAHDRIREDAEAHWAQILRRPESVGMDSAEAKQYVRLQRLALDLALTLSPGELFPLGELMDAAETDEIKALAMSGMMFVGGDYLDILDLEFYNENAGFIPASTVQALMANPESTILHESGEVLTSGNVKIRYRRRA